MPFFLDWLSLFLQNFSKIEKNIFIFRLTNGISNHLKYSNLVGNPTVKLNNSFFNPSKAKTEKNYNKGKNIKLQKDRKTKVLIIKHETKEKIHL